MTNQKLAWGCSERSGAIVCRCGSWNNVGFPTRTRCYSCRRPLFADLPLTETPTVVVRGLANLLAVIARAESFVTRRKAEMRMLQKEAKVVCTGTHVREKAKPNTRGAAKFITNGCGAILKISTLTYIQTHWYTEPHGCVSGDYWNAGEGQFECPNCHVINRLYQRPDVEALKDFFGTITNRYER